MHKSILRFVYLGIKNIFRQSQYERIHISSSTVFCVHMYRLMITTKYENDKISLASDFMIFSPKFSPKHTMEETTISKIIAASLVFLMTAIFGYLPSFVSRKAPLKSPGDPDYDKKSRRNVVFAFLLNFGGGVLFANCFCHWLPEVREAIEGFDIDSNLPLPEVIVSLGFFMVSFLEELIHHFVHPHQKKTDEVSIELQNHPEISKEETSEDHPEDHSEESVDRSQAKRTKSLLRTAFVVASLSFHSVMAGLTLGLENESAGVWINFGAIAMHKFVIAFSVGVELITSRVSLLNLFTEETDFPRFAELATASLPRNQAFLQNMF